MRSIVFCFFLIFTGLPISSFAMPVKEINVKSEVREICNLTTASINASAESEVRRNNIKIVNSIVNSSGLWEYINVAALDFSGTDVCAVSIEIQILTTAVTLYKDISNTPIAVLGELCTKAYIMSGPTYDLQTRVNDQIIDFTRQCISEVSKK
jgi:hypothetical protein